MKYFYGDWNSLSPSEKSLLDGILNDESITLDTQKAIVKLLSDILKRIEYLVNSRHFHDPQGKL